MMSQVERALLERENYCLKSWEVPVPSGDVGDIGTVAEDEPAGEMPMFHRTTSHVDGAKVIEVAAITIDEKLGQLVSISQWGPGYVWDLKTCEVVVALDLTAINFESYRFANVLLFGDFILLTFNHMYQRKHKIGLWDRKTGDLMYFFRSTDGFYCMGVHLVCSSNIASLNAPDLNRAAPLFSPNAKGKELINMFPDMLTMFYFEIESDELTIAGKLFNPYINLESDAALWKRKNAPENSVVRSRSDSMAPRTTGSLLWVDDFLFL